VFCAASFANLSLLLADLRPPQVGTNEKYEKISLVWSLTRASRPLRWTLLLPAASAQAPSLSCSLSRSLSHSLFRSLALSPGFLVLALSLARALFLSLSLVRTHSLSLALTCVLSLSLSLSLYLYLSPSLPFSLLHIRTPDDAIF